MKRTYKISIIAIFSLFICGLFVLLLALPKRDFSERENRYLQHIPVFSLKSLFRGDYTEDFESFTTDQFPVRDEWTTLKARLEKASGKKENNGVYSCADGYLLKRFSAPDDERIQEQIGYVNMLAENTDVPVYFALIPDSVEILSDKLPRHAPHDSQQLVMDAAYASFVGDSIDISSILRQHTDQYIYYRTDHHWTSLGAYYGASSLLDAFGLPVKALSEFEPKTVSDSFYGTTYSSSGYSWVRPDSMEIYVPDDVVQVTSYLTGTPQSGALYDFSRLETKDKYSMFLGGNTPRVDIQSYGDGERLLIIRDSFSDCLVPFLLDDFSEITLVDMRYFKEPLSSFIQNEGFDRVLVLYSVREFCEDDNFFMMIY